MSALPIDRPVPLRGGAAGVLQFPPPWRCPLPPAPVVAAPLRITRRGRLVITLLVCAVLAVAGVVAAFRALAGAEAPVVPVKSVLVLPGDTLWSIAGTVAEPGEDVLDVIADIVEMNDLETSAVFVGQRLTVPLPA